MGANRPGDHGEGPGGSAVQPEAGRLRLDQGRQLPVQQAVLHAGQPALGEVSRPMAAVAGLPGAPEAGGSVAVPPAPGTAGPWRNSLAQLVRDRAAVSAAAVFLLIVLACLAAPLYAHHVAHTDAFRSNIS